MNNAMRAFARASAVALPRLLTLMLVADRLSSPIAINANKTIIDIVMISVNPFLCSFVFLAIFMSQILWCPYIVIPRINHAMKKN
jgi:hypothetical protein